jgi:hypothetical protein
MEEINGAFDLLLCTTAVPCGWNVTGIEEGGPDAHGWTSERGGCERGRPRRVAANLLQAGLSRGDSSEENKGTTQAEDVAVHDQDGGASPGFWSTKPAPTREDRGETAHTSLRRPRGRARFFQE